MNGLFRPTPRNSTPNPDGMRECDPTFSLDRQIAQARREMGPARWAQLNAEWLADERTAAWERAKDIQDRNEGVAA